MPSQEHSTNTVGYFLGPEMHCLVVLFSQNQQQTYLCLSEKDSRNWVHIELRFDALDVLVVWPLYMHSLLGHLPYKYCIVACTCTSKPGTQEVEYWYTTCSLMCIIEGQGSRTSPCELVIELHKGLSATKIKFKESDFCACL